MQACLYLLQIDSSPSAPCFHLLSPLLLLIGTSTLGVESSIHTTTTTTTTAYNISYSRRVSYRTVYEVPTPLIHSLYVPHRSRRSCPHSFPRDYKLHHHHHHENRSMSPFKLQLSRYDDYCICLSHLEHHVLCCLSPERTEKYLVARPVTQYVQSWSHIPPPLIIGDAQQYHHPSCIISIITSSDELLPTL